MRTRRKLTPEGEGCRMTFTIEGTPKAKPRQTKSDVWKKRKCVVEYRAWADKARERAPLDLPAEPKTVLIKAFSGIPISWSKKKKAALVGQPHRQKPDWDNVGKAVCDALWKKDQLISDALVIKRWDDGKGARVEVCIVARSLDDVIDALGFGKKII